MPYRFGWFLIVIGGLLFIFFALSVQAREMNIFLCGGAGLCFLIGIILVIQYRTKKEAAQRFRTFNRLRGIDDKGKGK
jgi:hypothetical protein